MIHYCSEQKRLKESSKWDLVSVKDIIKYFARHKYIALDTETTGLDPHTCELISIQLGDFHNKYSSLANTFCV